ITDQNRLGGTHDHTGRLQPDIDAVRAEVTFLGRVILRINKDRIVRTSRHAGFATDADRFIEIDGAVRPFEHGRGGTGSHAWRVRGLVAAGDLVGAPHLRKNADIDVFHVGARDADGHDILGLAGGGARVTADAAGVVDDLGPLHAIFANWLGWIHQSVQEVKREYSTPKPGFARLRYLPNFRGNRATESFITGRLTSRRRAKLRRTREPDWYSGPDLIVLPQAGGRWRARHMTKTDKSRNHYD